MGKPQSVGQTDEGEEIDCMTVGVKSVCKCCSSYTTIRLKCDNIQCPNCWSRWSSKNTFKYAVKLEAYSHVLKQEYKETLSDLLSFTDSEVDDITLDSILDSVDLHRPCHVSASISDTNYSWSEIKTSLFRRGYRRLKKQMNVIAGLRIFHPFRVSKSKKKILRAEGWEPNKGDRLWSFVRRLVNDSDNSFELYDFVTQGLHFHSLAFPSILDSHTGTDFVCKRIDRSRLDSTSDVVRLLRYLLSHCGVIPGKDRNRPNGPFGALHHFSPEKELSEEKLLSIRLKVADTMGLGYDNDRDKLIFTEFEEETCPNCGRTTDDFLDSKDFSFFTQDDYNSVRFLIEENFSEDKAEILLSMIEDFIYSVVEQKRNFLQYSVWKEDLDEIFHIHLGKDPPKGADVVLKEKESKTPDHQSDYDGQTEHNNLRHSLWLKEIFEKKVGESYEQSE